MGEIPLDFGLGGVLLLSLDSRQSRITAGDGVLFSFSRRRSLLSLLELLGDLVGEFDDVLTEVSLSLDSFVILTLCVGPSDSKASYLACSNNRLKMLQRT